MSGLNYYLHHLGDHTKATAHISMAEEGAYRRLLDFYYAEGEPIAAEKAHKVARARTRSEHDAVDAVLNEYFSLRNGCWQHKRVTIEIKKAKKKIRASKTNGKLGGRPKKAQTDHQKKSEKASTDPPNQAEPDEEQKSKSKSNTPSTREFEKSENFNDDVVPADWRLWRSIFTKEWQCIPADDRTKGARKFRSLAEEWIAAGISFGKMRGAVEKSRSLSTEPIGYLPSYVTSVLFTPQYPQRNASPSLLTNMLGLNTDVSSDDSDNELDLE